MKEKAFTYITILYCFVVAGLIGYGIYKDKKVKIKQELIEYQINVINNLEDNLKDSINHYEDSIFVLNKRCDSLSTINDDIMEKYMLYEYKLERIDYYTKIVDKDNSQMIFYKGWIKRVLK